MLKINEHINKTQLTLNATWDLLVFFNLTALLVCFPGSSVNKKKTTTIFSKVFFFGPK